MAKILVTDKSAEEKMREISDKVDLFNNADSLVEQWKDLKELGRKPPDHDTLEQLEAHFVMLVMAEIADV